MICSWIYALHNQLNFFEINKNVYYFIRLFCLNWIVRCINYCDLLIGLHFLFANLSFDHSYLVSFLAVFYCEFANNCRLSPAKSKRKTIDVFWGRCIWYWYPKIIALTIAQFRLCHREVTTINHVRCECKQFGCRHHQW